MAEARQPLVLVADDDAGVRNVMERTLRPLYRLVFAENGTQALQMLFEHKPNLVVLDVSMPMMDGWQVFQRIRELTDVPVIMVTARTADHDVVRGLDMGVADYITKPFSPSQLVARVQAALRRYASTRPARQEVFTFDGGRLVVDTLRQVAVINGKEVSLSATEYRMLELFARHAGQVLSHDQILDHVWGPSYVGQRGYVKTFVGVLRGKIEPDPHNPVYIMARRGLGYYLEQRHVGDGRPGEEGGSSAAEPERAAVLN